MSIWKFLEQPNDLDEQLLENGEKCLYFTECLLDDFRADRREILALLMAIAPAGDHPDHLADPSGAELDVDAIAAVLDAHKLRNKIADEGWGRELRTSHTEALKEQGYLINPDTGWRLLEPHGNELRSADGQPAQAEDSAQQRGGVRPSEVSRVFDEMRAAVASGRFTVEGLVKIGREGLAPTFSTSPRTAGRALDKIIGR
jgi:hypothetical protein